MIEQGTLHLIKIPRVSSGQPYQRRLVGCKRKQRDKAAGSLVTIATVSLMLNIAQAVVIYILEAGPV